MSKIADKKKRIIEQSLCELKQHNQTMDNFFASVSEPLQIIPGETTKKNLWKILLIDIQSRRGRKLNVNDIQAIKTEFFRTVDLNKARRLYEENRFNYLYSKIIELPNIGPKIASCFMKNMVCKFSIFTELKKYLFLPIDLHIGNILTHKLGIFERTELCKYNPFESRRANAFQSKLAEIHSPRVDLDEFWYIGYLFCSKRCKLICKELCWIRKYCQEPVADYGTVQI